MISKVSQHCDFVVKTMALELYKTGYFYTKSTSFSNDIIDFVFVKVAENGLHEQAASAVACFKAVTV